MLKTALAVFCVSAAAFGADSFVNAQLTSHNAVLDSQGKLLAWNEPAKSLGYDHVLRLGWDFIEHKVARDTKHHTGLKLYLVNTLSQGETQIGQHNPAMVFATFVDSLIGWYPYSGDKEAISAVREMLDYQLAHGTTPLDWKWAGVPFATSCIFQTEYGRCFKNMPSDFYGGIETDKVGALGLGYLMFYELTGEERYLDAALRAADALAAHVRPGDDQHTPWPYRVDAHSGSTLSNAEYGGEVVDPVRLFDELLRIGRGNTASYRKARDMAWNWLLNNPLNVKSPAWDKWSGYFEDTGYNPANLNQALPTMTAYYILNRENPAEVDPQWLVHVGHLIDWVRLRFGRGPYLGAWGIDEQGGPNGPGCCSRAGIGSGTSRWAAINAMYSEKTHDLQAREDAFRSLNYATYFAASDGKITCCGEGFPNQYWFSDGYSDYLRNFSWAMGAAPEFAPAGADHLLRSSSVVRTVKYGPKTLDYNTFDAAGTQVLRLTYKPVRITSGGQILSLQTGLNAAGYTVQPLTGGDYLVRVRHSTSGQIAIRGE